MIAQPTTAFTYQGHLMDGGSPANGSYDFVFYLFEGETPSPPFEVVIGGPLNHPGVAVTNGLFEIVLDPGAATINDHDTHWLSTQVRLTGDPSYTTLAPRQRLYPVPLATRAVTADNAGDLDLPYAGTGQNVALPLFSITNTSDNGGAGIRSDVTGLSGGTAVEAITTKGTAVYGESADGPGGEFTSHNADTFNGAALHAYHTLGRGAVALFESTNDFFSGDVVRAELRSDAVSTYALHGILNPLAVGGPGFNSAGVKGENNSLVDEGYGVWGHHDRSGIGVYGTGGTGVAGVGSGQNFAVGVKGTATTGDKGRGVWGIATGTDSAAIRGEGTDGALAAIFFGDISILGNLAKSSGTFKIDHPQDPANRYLSHSFVESPDMMNVYNGVVTLDSHGNATVSLPSYFQSLNTDFRYQLTCIGGFAPVYIDTEINDSDFAIAGGTPGLRVSWQVTGVRADPYAKANPVIVEEEKSDADKGRYLHPEVLGLPPELRIGFEETPEKNH